MSSTSIPALRQELRIALGTNYPRYMVVMRDWFISGHNRLDWDFDMPFLTGRAKELHNTLMLSILQLCTSPQFESRKPSSPAIPSEFVLAIDNSTKNVLTLHAAPPEEFETSTDIPATTFPPIPTPPLASDRSRSVSEEDVEDDDTSEDSGVKPVFVLRLRKAATDETNESVHFRDKSDMRLRIPPMFLNEMLIAGRDRVTGDAFATFMQRLNLKKYLDAEPALLQYFYPEEGSGDSVSSSEASLPGRILVKSWEFGIRSIDSHVVPCLVRAAKDRVSLLIRELIKERKSFRLKSNGQVQFEDYHRNPYLLSKHHLPSKFNAERRPYFNILVEPVILPPDTERLEICEQLAALSAATSIESPSSSSNCPTKINLMDLYMLLSSNPDLNLGGVEGRVFLEKLLVNSSGSLVPYATTDESDSEDMDAEEGPLLPTSSY